MNIDPTDNPAIVAAQLLGVDPNPQWVAYLDQLMVECEGCGEAFALDGADTSILPDTSRLLVTSGRHYAHIPNV